MWKVAFSLLSYKCSTRLWPYPSVCRELFDDIIHTIAEAYSLKPVIDRVLAALPLAHQDQANE